MSRANQSHSLRHRAAARFGALTLAVTLLAGGPAARAEGPEGTDSEAAREKARLLQLQGDIFRLNIEADYAAALKKLCDTGYGDRTLCRSASAPPQQQQSPDAPPSVAEITGFAGQLTATLVYPDGGRMKVSGPAAGRPAARLRGNERVIAVYPDRVVIARDGEEPTVLPYAAPRSGG